MRKILNSRELRRKQKRMAHKRKGKRMDRKEIDNQYTMLCTELGDLGVKKNILEMQIAQVHKKINQLQIMANELDQKPVAPVEPVAPEETKEEVESAPAEVN